ncbi:lymphocyte-specific helicase-like [Fopius arisanus]|uniref:Lymphocyte-specific helicase-like n=1 Tax=Fopius arisanus TaxID=64838 RepID=A0A9R1T2F8_9HYME|nr:PREDICTED: lymphocyte-specific helicase-like [Fopius arisanus]
MEGEFNGIASSTEEIDKNYCKSSSPEGIGQCEDSGFASIAGFIPENDEQSKLAEAPVVQTRADRERQHQENLAAKREADLQYEKEKREQAYKRLMHLLKQSKFYSDFLLKKLSAPKPPKSSKRKLSDADIPLPAAKRSKRRYPTPEDDLKVSLPLRLQNRITRHGMKLSDKEIQAELAVIDDDEPPQDVITHPKYFTGELRDYQQEGLQWLKALYENGMSGILADEMGLGKTIQVIAMIAHLLEKRQAGPFLIIAPLSTIPNWLMEFERFAPKIPVVLLYGTSQERVQQARTIKKTASVDGFRTLPVVLTTYEIIIRDRKAIRGLKWRYIIMDEAQRIKNAECQLLQALKTCESSNRLLLTGTPLQNNLKELWSLLHFLMPQIFSDLAVFESWFDVKDFQHEEGTNRIIQQEEERKVLQSLREILKPFMLRRLKSDVCLDIPGKKEVMVYAPMSALQKQLYTAYLNRDIYAMYKTKPEPLIVDDEFGNRPKRRCTIKIRYPGSRSLENRYRTGTSSDDDSRSPTPDPDYSSSSLEAYFQSQDPSKFDSGHGVTQNEVAPPKTAIVEKAMENWTEHVDVTEDNCYYLFRLSFGSRQVMYRKIINHPYLIHLPLNDAGLPKVDEELITASGKFVVLDRMLKKLNEAGHKVLLFSTMKMILDVVEDYLSMRPWKYLRLDGEVDIETRKHSISLFNNDPQYFLFIITTRAGGVGLNLASADTVIIFDSDWNPQVDVQAMARCHRIGQNRPVVVYRLCTKGTFDEAIISRAEAKRKLEKLVISKEIEEMKLFNREGLIKLKILLDSSEQQVANSGKEFLSEEELEKLLDRSDLEVKV